MKIFSEDDGRTSILPETVEEKAAADYLMGHMPIFAGMEMNIFRAFMAGIEWAMRQTVENPDDRKED